MKYNGNLVIYRKFVMKKIVIGVIVFMGVFVVILVMVKEIILVVGLSSVILLMEVFFEIYVKMNFEVFIEV